MEKYIYFHIRSALRTISRSLATSEYFAKLLIKPSILCHSSYLTRSVVHGRSVCSYHQSQILSQYVVTVNIDNHQLFLC